MRARPAGLLGRLFFSAAVLLFSLVLLLCGLLHATFCVSQTVRHSATQQQYMLQVCSLYLYFSVLLF